MFKIFFLILTWFSLSSCFLFLDKISTNPSCKCIPKNFPCRERGYELHFNYGKLPPSCLPGLFMCCDKGTWERVDFDPFNVMKLNDFENKNHLGILQTDQHGNQEEESNILLPTISKAESKRGITVSQRSMVSDNKNDDSFSVNFNHIYLMPSMKPAIPLTYSNLTANFETNSIENTSFSNKNKFETVTWRAYSLSSFNDIKTSTLNDIKTPTINDMKTSTINGIKTSTLNYIKTLTINDIKTSTINDIKTSTINDIKTSTISQSLSTNGHLLINDHTYHLSANSSKLHKLLSPTLSFTSKTSSFTGTIKVTTYMPTYVQKVKQDVDIISQDEDSKITSSLTNKIKRITNSEKYTNTSVTSSKRENLTILKDMIKVTSAANTYKEIATKENDFGVAMMPDHFVDTNIAQGENDMNVSPDTYKEIFTAAYEVNSSIMTAQGKHSRTTTTQDVKVRNIEIITETGEYMETTTSQYIPIALQDANVKTTTSPDMQIDYQYNVDTISQNENSEMTIHDENIESTIFLDKNAKTTTIKDESAETSIFQDESVDTISSQYESVSTTFYDRHIESITFQNVETITFQDQNVETTTFQDQNIETSTSLDEIVEIISQDENVDTTSKDDNVEPTHQIENVVLPTFKDENESIAYKDENVMPAPSKVEVETITTQDGNIEMTTFSSETTEIISSKNIEMTTSRKEHNEMTTFPSENIEMTTFPSENIEMTTFPSENIEMTTFPSENIEMTTFPSENIEMTTFPSENIEMTTFPSENAELTTFPSENTEMTAFPSKNIEMTTFPSENTKMTTFPSENIEMTTFPSENTKMTTFPSENIEMTTFSHEYIEPTIFSSKSIKMTLSDKHKEVTSRSDLYQDTNVETIATLGEYVEMITEQDEYSEIDFFSTNVEITTQESNPETKYTKLTTIIPSDYSEKPKNNMKTVTSEDYIEMITVSPIDVSAAQDEIVDVNIDHGENITKTESDDNKMTTRTGVISSRSIKNGETGTTQSEQEIMSREDTELTTPLNRLTLSDKYVEMIFQDNSNSTTSEDKNSERDSGYMEIFKWTNHREIFDLTSKVESTETPTTQSNAEPTISEIENIEMTTPRSMNTEKTINTGENIEPNERETMYITTVSGNTEMTVTENAIDMISQLDDIGMITVHRFREDNRNESSNSTLEVTTTQENNFRTISQDYKVSMSTTEYEPIVTEKFKAILKIVQDVKDFKIDIATALEDKNKMIKEDDIYLVDNDISYNATSSANDKFTSKGMIMDLTIAYEVTAKSKNTDELTTEEYSTVDIDTSKDSTEAQRLNKLDESFDRYNDLKVSQETSDVVMRNATPLPDEIKELGSLFSTKDYYDFNTSINTIFPFIGNDGVVLELPPKETTYKSAHQILGKETSQEGNEPAENDGQNSFSKYNVTSPPLIMANETSTQVSNEKDVDYDYSTTEDINVVSVPQDRFFINESDDNSFDNNSNDENEDISDYEKFQKTRPIPITFVPIHINANDEEVPKQREEETMEDEPRRDDSSVFSWIFNVFN